MLIIYNSLHDKLLRVFYII